MKQRRTVMTRIALINYYRGKSDKVLEGMYSLWGDFYARYYYIEVASWLIARVAIKQPDTNPLTKRIYLVNDARELDFYRNRGVTVYKTEQSYPDGTSKIEYYIKIRSRDLYVIRRNYFLRLGLKMDDII